MRRGQVIRFRQQVLIGALRRIIRDLLDEVAFHAVDMFLRLDLVVAGEEAGQARMSDRNVQMVGIIVGDRLPVERPSAERDPADRPQLLEPVSRDFMFIGRHHLAHGRRARLERHEDEPAPGLECDGEEAELFGLQAGVFLAMRHADQPPVAGIAPGVIRAGEDLRAAAVAVDEP